MMRGSVGNPLRAYSVSSVVKSPRHSFGLTTENAEVRSEGHGGVDGGVGYQGLSPLRVPQTATSRPNAWAMAAFASRALSASAALLA